MENVFHSKSFVMESLSVPTPTMRPTVKTHPFLGSTFRLVNGSDTSGYVEVLFRSRWQPVCSPMTLNTIDGICGEMRIGSTGKAERSERSLANGWNVICDMKCELRRSEENNCQSQARISCISVDSGRHFSIEQKEMCEIFIDAFVLR
ncbi:unnamed protein product [Caenorhabditis auriculariae]|uniref:SRCR domain-containing protein n=1 Tax=Caenorhabditis auriculariae TaxID=2777116 RepID=A0A8S1HMY3_9PELO|nr:unnamed protein product [Caenorhabditis auriculariae]